MKIKFTKGEVVVENIKWVKRFAWFPVMVYPIDGSNARLCDECTLGMQRNVFNEYEFKENVNEKYLIWFRPYYTRYFRRNVLNRFEWAGDNLNKPHAVKCDEISHQVEDLIK